MDLLRSFLLSTLIFCTANIIMAQNSVPQQLLDSAWRLYTQNQLAEAKEVNALCIDKSRLAKDFKTEAQSLINQGTIVYVEGDFENAYAWYDSSYQIYQHINDTVQMVNALRNMAMTARRSARYGEGIQLGSIALTLLHRPEHNALKAQVLRTLATLFESINNLKQAKETLRRALLLTPHNERFHLYNNLGNTYFKMDRIDSAIYCYKAALRLSSDSQLRGLILNNLGESYLLLDSIEKANEYLSQSLLLRQTHDSLALISTHNNIAQLFLRQNKFREADRYLLKVNHELSERPNEREALKFFLLRKTYFEHTGQFQKALQFDVLYDSLNRKIFEEERIKGSELHAAFELNEREQLLATERKSLSLRTSELKQKNLVNKVITGAVFFLSLIVITLFWLYRVNAKLRYKNEILAHELNHRVKNNLQMIASLLSVQSSSYQDNTIKSILSQNEHRIQSIALLHRMLYNNEALSNVPLKSYIQDLTSELNHAVGKPCTTFQLHIAIAQLPIEKTVSLGLILNELITNSMKYALPEGTLQISISLTQTNTTGELRYSDNGKKFNEAHIESGNFGMRLIAIQAKQLKGKYRIANDSGFLFELTFPVFSISLVSLTLLLCAA